MVKNQTGKIHWNQTATPRNASDNNELHIIFSKIY